MPYRVGDRVVVLDACGPWAREHLGNEGDIGEVVYVYANRTGARIRMITGQRSGIESAPIMNRLKKIEERPCPMQP